MAEEVTSIGVAVDTNGIDRGIRSLEALAAQGPKVEKSMKGIESATSNAGKNMQGVGSAGAKAQQTFNGLSKSAKNAEQATLSLSDAMNSLQSLALGVGVASVAAEYLRLADAATNVNSRLKLVTESSAQLANAQSEIFRIAQTTRASYVELANTYAQMARATKELGVSQRDMLAVTETISKAVTISGGSAASAQAALTQLAQGFASGTLRGEELNSVLEQTPRLAQAIAQGLGVSIGQLRALGSEGQLTSEKVLGALQKAAPAIDREFGQMALTVEQSMTQVGNSLTKLVDTIEQITGASSIASAGISSFASGLDVLNTSIKNMASANSLSDFFLASLQSSESLNADMKIAEKQLDDLTKRLQKAPDNIYVKSQIADVQKLIGELKEAKQRLDALSGATSGASADPRENYQSPGASYNAWLKEQEKAQQKLLEISARQNGVTKQFQEDLQAYADGLRTGKLTTDQYVAAVSDLNKARYASTEAGKKEAAALRDASSAAKSGVNAYQTLAQKANEYTKTLKLESEQGSKLTQSQKLQLELDTLIASANGKATAARVAGIQAAIDEGKLLEQQVESYRAAAAAAEDLAKFKSEYYGAMAAGVDDLAKTNQQMREEVELIGLTEEAQHAINKARIESQITVKETHLAELQRANDVHGFMSQEQILLQQQIELLRERLQLMDDRKVRTANKQAQDKIKSDWDKTAQTIGDTLADYIMGGGKDAATYLKRLFSTLVLQPVVQTVVGGILGTGAAGASGVASGGVGGIANLLQQGYSALNSPLLSNFGGGLANSLQGMGGSLFGKGFETLGTSVTNFGNTVAQFSDAINIAGDVFGYGSALYSLSKGNYGSAIGAAAGTYFGGPIGSAIGSALGGMLDGVFGGGSTPHKGGTAVSVGGQQYEITNANTHRQRKFDPNVPKAFAPMVQQISAIASEALGKAIEASVSFRADGQDKSYGWYHLADMQGNLLAGSGDRGKYSSNPEKGIEQVLNRLTSDLIGVLQKSAKGVWQRDVYKSLGSDADLDALQQAVTYIKSVEAAFASWGATLTGFKNLSNKAQSSLMSFSGGFEALSANVEGFYANYYTEQERIEKSTQDMTKALAAYGVELPKSAEEYRALVEQQLKAGASGAELAAVMLGMQGTFKQVSDTWARDIAEMQDQVTGFFDDLKASIAGARGDVAADRASILRGDQTMTYAEISKAISRVGVASLSMTKLNAAASAESAAEAAVKAAEKAVKTANAKSTSASAAQAAYMQPSIERKEQSAIELVATYLRHGNVQNSLQGESVPESLRKYITRTSSQADMLKRLEGISTKDAVAFANQLLKLGADDLSGRFISTDKYEKALAQYQSAVDAEQSKSESLKSKRLQEESSKAAKEAEKAEKALAKARENLAKAQKNSQKTEQQYAKQAQKLALDAAAGVEKLSSLRGEVLSFYDAQVQAVEVMIASANNLRSAIDSVRMSQLNGAQSVQELSRRYAMDYSLARATTGEVRAGYADNMAANLGVLTDAIRSESSSATDWRVQSAKLLAQANQVAGLLESDAAKTDPAAQAVKLLNQIDASLAKLQSSTITAEQLITDAINQSSASNLQGLRAVVAALTGKKIPSFDVGTNYVPGDMFARIHQGEAIIPKAFNPWAGGNLPRMGGSDESVVKELKAFRDDDRRIGTETIRLLQRVAKLVERWDVEGTPTSRDETTV